MRKIAAALLLSLGMTSAQAVPITFTSSTYFTSAFADVDGTSDGPFAISPPDALPIASSASVSGDGGMAEADAMADDSFLSASTSASTSASSTGSVAQASAVATFFGEFTTPGGSLSLLVDFDSDTADSTLDILWLVDGNLLPVSGSGLFTTDDLPAGLPGTLDITLISTSFADAPDITASNESVVSFALNAAAVPEPATLALVLGGLGLLGLGRGFSVPGQRPAP
jgi:hypothetical protein